MCYWAYLVIHKVSYFSLRSFTEDLGSSAVPFVLLSVQVKSESQKTQLWPRVFLKHLLIWLHPITFLHEGWDPKQGFDKESISAGTISSTEFSLLSSLYFFVFLLLVVDGQLQPLYHFVLSSQMPSFRKVKLYVPCNFIGSWHLDLPYEMWFSHYDCCGFEELLFYHKTGRKLGKLLQAGQIQGLADTRYREIPTGFFF